MNKKGLMLVIFLTAFIDMLGIGLVIPVFGHLFLDVNGILPGDYSLGTRTMLLGLLIAAYPFAQFFGSPILGALSDRHGRKKILLLSLGGTFIGYMFFAYGIMTRNLSMLFVSRLLDGFTGGNISTIMSAIADLSDSKEKAMNFGMIGMAFGMGFILGPFFGGLLSDSSILPFFTHSTPFFFAAGLSVINIISVVRFFTETSKTRLDSRISLLTGARNIIKAFSLEGLRTMFIVMFLMTLGFNFFTQFFQVFLIEKFAFTQSQIGNLFAYMGIWIAFTQGVLNRKISRIAQPQQVLRFSILVLGLALPFILLPAEPWMILLVMPFISVSNGLTMPNASAIVSNLSAKDSQGEILGINQSVQSLAMTIPPIISGFIVTFSMSMPVIVASVFVLLAWLFFVLFYKKQVQVFHEV